MAGTCRCSQTGAWSISLEPTNTAAIASSVERSISGSGRSNPYGRIAQPMFRVTETIFELHHRTVRRRLDQLLPSPSIASDFQTKSLSKPGLSFLEHRYLSGFYEYILGSFLETKQDQRAGGHFERSYGCLRPFATSLAHTARCVLGVKMNWFHLLERCGPSSFYRAKHFFMEGCRDLRETSDKQSSLRLEHPQGLYVDPFTETLLMAIESFYQHDYSGSRVLLQRLSDSHFSLNRNNEDKLWLLTARVHISEGARSEAVDAYRHLEHHPLFGEEAERFL